MKLTRRGGVGLAAAAGCMLSRATADPVLRRLEQPGLNTIVARCGGFYGAALDDQVLATDATYMDHVRVECGIITGETAFKWSALRPSRGVFDFAKADLLMDYARRHGMAARGHTLLWHGDNPAWLADTMTPTNAENLLVQHIAMVAGHCRASVSQWDVVNEVVWPQDGKVLGLRDTLWFRAMGSRLLDVAFHACSEADPSAMRCINDFGLDYAWDEDNRKREAMLTLLSNMTARGIPVQALGIQAHLDASVKELDQAIVAKFCANVASMGLSIIITELDIRDNRLPGDVAIRDAAIASHARAYLDAVLSCPAVLGVLTWGLSDRRSWLNDAIPRDDRLPQRALPLDVNFSRKPLWSAMAAAFAAAPMRS